MCTVSWLHVPGGYHLLCNRDERRTRSEAIAPRMRQAGAVRFLAPVDPDGGGTWIAVTDHGIGLCLLNGAAPAPGARSRGLLVQELAVASSIGECALWLSRMDLRQYAGFTLLMLSAQSALVADWDGVALGWRENARPPLVSSSFDLPGVTRHRMEADFARRAARAVRQASWPVEVTSSKAPITLRMLHEFHASHAPRPDAYSVCMHRPDAHTVSFSRITVDEHEVRFDYSPAAPCKSHACHTVLVGRAPRPAAGHLPGLSYTTSEATQATKNDGLCHPAFCEVICS